MAWGEYPPEYNAKVHGTYDPGRYYGPKDTKFSQVKLGELFSWIGRRNYGPQGTVSAVSRSYWRFCHRWLFPVKPTMAGYMQMTSMFMLFFYVTNYGKYRHHRLYKYHW